MTKGQKYNVMVEFNWADHPMIANDWSLVAWGTKGDVWVHHSKELTAHMPQMKGAGFAPDAHDARR